VGFGSDNEVHIVVVFSEGSDRYVELVYTEREYLQDVVSGMNLFIYFFLQVCMRAHMTLKIRGPDSIDKEGFCMKGPSDTLLGSWRISYERGVRSTTNSLVKMMFL
jgi:hypothetical protein